ncbi:MAG TPA: hypothetical protein DCP69_09950 [Candidatus Omnitrophica bacterium]|nr:hypothetical protein [Candidatus Omnitrophota bacterium]
MPNRVTWEGLAEFKAELRNLPAHLRDEADGIVANAANTAAREVVDKYPTVTGNLKDGVKVRKDEAGTFGVAYRVRSTAPHAHLYEYGHMTKQLKLGGRNRVPGKPTVVPVAIRRRRQMYDELMAMLRREGFQVTGDVR